GRMNRIQKEFLAIKKCAGIYLRYRTNPEDYANSWILEKKGRNYTTWYNKYRTRLVPFRDKFAGKDCFIIGNGPSLNKMNLEALNEYYTFGLNKIFLIFKRVSLDLDFLVSVNPLVIQQSIGEFNKLKIPKFISYVGAKDVGNFDDNTFFIYTKGGLESSGDLTKPINEGYTVTNVALQVAHYLGFKNVFLVGVDHSFKQQGNPNEKQTMHGEDVNHFDPNYFKGHQWQLADLEGSELAYRNTKFFYTRTGRKIYDATVEGKLEVFDKISFDEALLIAKKK
ncbi:MAG TPA: 6-hydroxymethylpterin diphosphokinase MptE-like protein, partial [Cyclobacteriaceae bacterium]